MNFFSDWEEVPDNTVYDNGFKVQWEQFLRHDVEDAPFSYTFAEGAKGVQLAQAGYESSKNRQWVDLEDLDI